MILNNTFSKSLSLYWFNSSSVVSVTILPLLMIRIELVIFTNSLNIWLEIKKVMPSSAFYNEFSNISYSLGSNPFIGSSKIISWG